MKVTLCSVMNSVELVELMIVKFLNFGQHPHPHPQPHDAGAAVGVCWGLMVNGVNVTVGGEES